MRMNTVPEDGRPRAFHVMAKPTGSACNLDCEYCFFLKKWKLYPGSKFHMSDAVHDAYITQLFAAHRVPRVTVAWQGGEPTLMGLDFFRRSVDFQKAHAKPGTVIENTFQTNGILLDDEWCRFFYENNFLVGLSLDGPRALHDTYRKDKAGRGTFERVMKALRLLQAHNVEFNILCTVNSKNADYPLEVYRFFRDEARIPYLQFIPIVERDNDTGYQEGSRVTDRSVKPEQYGRFLVEIFDEWVRKDVGRAFVLNFDGALAGWLGMAGSLCIFGPTCGLGMALEDNGDLYSCDHFVDWATFWPRRWSSWSHRRSSGDSVWTSGTPCRSTAAGASSCASATGSARRTACSARLTARQGGITSARGTRPSSGTRTRPCGPWRTCCAGAGVQTRSCRREWRARAQAGEWVAEQNRTVWRAVPRANRHGSGAREAGPRGGAVGGERAGRCAACALGRTGRGRSCRSGNRTS